MYNEPSYVEISKLCASKEVLDTTNGFEESWQTR